MAEHSGIEWTHHTFNPWWGCARVSPACEHCYAETFAHWVAPGIWGAGAERRFFGDAHWREPIKSNARAAAKGERHRVFCASMADVFEARSDLDQHRERLWRLVEATSNLDWLMLTKRPQNVATMAPSGGKWASNVWLGTTVEDQRREDERLPHLVAQSAVVRFLSVEPLLGPLDLRAFLPEVDWVILGGESGHGARAMEIAWARSVRDQCVEFGVPLHFKQWGNHAQVDGKGEQLVKLRRKDVRKFDGRTWDEFPIAKLSRCSSVTSAELEENATSTA